MRFWDTSALVPLVVEESRSSRCRHLLRSDRVVVVWALTATEIASAIRRLHRESALDRAEVARAERRTQALASRWTEIDAVIPVREQADRLLRVHPLRAADALQLAAALVAVDHRPRRRQFVALDRLLLDAAEGEGFDGIEPARAETAPRPRRT